MEEISVTIPGDRAFGAVAGLVLGGVAARHDLTIDVLDDLQLALESLLERNPDEGEVTIVLRVGTAVVDAAVGPFDRATVAELEQEADERLGLRRLLTAVVDSVELADREDGCWVDLHKTYALTAEVH